MIRSIVLLALCGVMLIISPLGCSNPQKQKAKAEAREAEARATMEEERLRMMKAYHDCLNKQGLEGLQKCEHLKGAAGN